MARSLRGDPKAVAAREADDLDDILGRLDKRDSERPLVDCEIPGLPGIVPVRIARKHDLAVDPRVQGADVGRGSSATATATGRYASREEGWSHDPLDRGWLCAALWGSSCLLGLWGCAASAR